MDLLDRVSLIEERLKLGTDLSGVRVHDSELLTQIVESFRKVWRLFNQYPSQLRSELNETLFLGIFEEMSPVFSRYDSNPLLNSDVGYSSFLTDEETLEHLALMVDFEMLTLCEMKENNQVVPYSSSTVNNLTDDSQHVNPMRTVIQEGSGPSIAERTWGEGMNENGLPQPRRGSKTLEDAITSGVVQSRSSNESSAVLYVDRENQAKNDLWIQRRENTSYCDLCECELVNDETSIQQHINGRRHQKDNQWISMSQGASNGQYYSCDLCNVSSSSFTQLKQHFDAKNHHLMEMEFFLYRSVLERLEGSSDQDAEANNRILRRTNYFLNESCIIRSRCGSPTFYNCILCDVDLIGDDRVLAHLKDDRTHTMKLDGIIRNFDVNSLPFKVAKEWL